MKRLIGRLAMVADVEMVPPGIVTITIIRKEGVDGEELISQTCIPTEHLMDLWEIMFADLEEQFHRGILKQIKEEKNKGKDK